MPIRPKAAPIATASNPSQEAIPQRWFDVAAAAIYLIVSQGFVRNLIHDGTIKATRLGNTFRIDKSDLDLLLESRKKFQAPYRKGTRPAVARRWDKYRAAKQSKQKRAAQ